VGARRFHSGKPELGVGPLVRLVGELLSRLSAFYDITDLDYAELRKPDP